ncbi:FAD-dependent monooxygenase [Paenimyroides tangerinum]|uniref:Kynurenine 3-monooxygenase n=1 Tax=Paenimyroides tangerinum TaxID=2488728 RepID=A0A3P3WDR6_9FLAO|nr:NAD(P)/FAD-dependent oxidoreductase [Paenimyroides tangerinum]RRJ92784.1 FAD-dependent monooxygenase [Paenimyroides tangerinum]
MKQDSLKVAVIGAGLVGTLLAIYLKKAGHDVHVFDRSADIRKIEFSGRSINLAISTRGWKSLDDVQIGDQIREIAIPMDKRAIHKKDGTLAFQKYGMKGESIYSVSRGGLNRLMIDIAEEKGIHFHFEQKIWDVNLEEAIIHIGETERGDWTDLKFDKVFGTDGAFSRVRHRMQRQNLFDYSQVFLKLGYKELCIPANEDGTHKIDPNSFHIWPRSEFMLIALANEDGSFTCTLFMPFEGENSFEAINTEEKVKDFFMNNFPDTKELIPDLVADYFKNPTSSLITTHCYPWTFKDKVALLGDAAHAIVPFYGQGMNAGFEDISEMYRQMEKHGNDWETIFEEYQKIRKPNADAIAELSFRNFVEMGTNTADEKFLLQKKIEAKFTEKYPNKWLPLYDRVTFSLNPYIDALAIGDQQKNIMDEIMSIENIENIWDSEEIESMILSKLK